MKPAWIMSGALAIAACASAEDYKAPGGRDDAAEYARLALGSWSSRDQSADPAYDWVESETVRVLTDRIDGIWLYQENAVLAASPDAPPAAGAKDQPYFQVVIQLQALGDGEVHTTTYRLDTAAARAGAKGLWRDPSRDFAPEWIGTVACMGHMRRVAEGFWQGAVACPNGYKGGVKVDSRSIRSPDAYVNWDRGFDLSGRQVWGPATGGYIFNRKGNVE